MTRREAANFRRCHPDTIDNNRIPWSDDPPPPGKFRYKMFQIGGVSAPRIWREDVENSGVTSPLVKV
jgi:hypothetical protein